MAPLLMIVMTKMMMGMIAMVTVCINQSSAAGVWRKGSHLGETLLRLSDSHRTIDTAVKCTLAIVFLPTRVSEKAGTDLESPRDIVNAMGALVA